MKITATRDYDAGTLQVVLDIQIAADTDQAADAAWRAVTAELTSAQRARGTAPTSLRTPIAE